jgi:phosphatidylserine/phosphatidylglycerophosphate/cardiolipin synthase-like enzyme
MVDTAGGTHVIELDQGHRLHEILERAAQGNVQSRLDVSTPFLDGDSRLFRLMLKAAQRGVQTRLLTRLDRRLAQYGLIPQLVGAGVRLCNVPMLHAKAVILENSIYRQKVGWIGSANFTTASEGNCLELGVLVTGDAAAEFTVLAGLSGFFDAWERAYLKPHFPR